MTQPPGYAQTAQPTRRRARWERYRVTHPFSAKAQAGLWGSIAGVVALAALLGAAMDVKGGVVIVAAVPFIIAWFEGQRTAFQFDAAGVRIGAVVLPWTDVTQFVVAPPNGQHALIGVRLRQGAGLPAGVPFPPPHPAMPAPLHVTVLAEKFDLAKMIQKAHKYAPRHVRIVLADAHSEQVVA
ncbi:hypothetical protein [Actinophytocola sediminis]